MDGDLRPDDAAPEPVDGTADGAGNAQDGAPQAGDGVKRARFVPRPSHHQPLPLDHPYRKDALEALEQIWARQKASGRIPTIEEDDAAMAKARAQVVRELFGSPDDPETDE